MTSHDSGTPLARAEALVRRIQETEKNVVRDFELRSDRDAMDVQLAVRDACEPLSRELGNIGLTAAEAICLVALTSKR